MRSKVATTLLLLLAVASVEGSALAQETKAKGATLKGRIVANQLGGQAMARVTVSADGANTTESRDPDGRFTLIFPNKEPGDTVEVIVSKSGYIVVNSVQLRVVLPKIADAEPLILLMCKESEREEWARIFYRLKSHGPCSPNLADIQGDITINCPGVNPELMRFFNQQLAAKGHEIQDLKDKLRAAEEWSTKYFELTERLAAAGIKSELSRKAEELVESGRFDEAGTILDDILKEEEKDVDKVAADHFSRGRLYELQFQPLDALPHYEKAYSYRSDNALYALVYAGLLLRQNQFEKAEHIYAQTLAALTKSDNKAIVYQPDLAGSLNNLGLLYADTKRFPEAEEALKEALKAFRELATANPATYEPALAGALNNLGGVYRETERFVEAEGAYNEALQIRRRLAKANPTVYDPAFAGTLYNLGILYTDMLCIREAEEYLKEALHICQRLADENPAAYKPELAKINDGLGSIYANTRRFREAEEVYKETLQVRRTLAQANPDAYEPDLANTLNSIGGLYRDTQQPEQAEGAYKESIKIYRRLAHSNRDAFDADLARALNNLGLVYNDAERFPEAEDAFKEALGIRRRLAQASPAPFERNLARTLNNLGNVYTHTQRFAEAERVHNEALEIRRRLAQADPATYEPDLAETLNNLGSVYIQTQKLPEAEVAFKGALQIRHRLAKANPAIYGLDLARTLNNLGALYVETHCLPEAEETYKEALAMRRWLATTSPGADEPELAQTLYNMGSLYGAMQRFSKAEESFGQASEIYRRLWEKNHALYGDPFALTLLQMATAGSEEGKDFEALCLLVDEATKTAQTNQVKERAINMEMDCPKR